jgi:hypothetical protein
MTKLQAFGQLADRDALTAGKPFNRKQGLVLLRRDSRSNGGFLAKSQELPQRVTKRCEVSIL